jgi:hypothetical protein
MGTEGMTWENDPELPLTDEALARAGEIIADADKKREEEGMPHLALEETALPPTSEETEEDRIRRVLGPRK